MHSSDVDNVPSSKLTIIAICSSLITNFSGMTAVICTYPLDVIRARLAFQVKGDHRYTGIANAFHTIYLKVIC